VAANTTFKTIADQLRILYDPAHQYHPEFQGYTRGTKIKQADTILLGYPLLFGTNSSTAAEVRKNDLDYYQTVTDQNGPAMTWSMFSIGYGDVGEDDKAASFFSRGYSQNSLGAFHDWHEVVGASGANNFITGAGGFMQSVWAGYGGVRFVNGALRLQRPRPPPNCTAITLKHFSFRGSSMTLKATASSWTIQLDPMPTTHGGEPALSGVATTTFSVQQDGKAASQQLSSTPIAFPAGSSATVSASSSSTGA